MRTRTLVAITRSSRGKPSFASACPTSVSESAFGVDIRRVDEVDAGVECRLDLRLHLGQAQPPDDFPASFAAVGHRAEADFRYVQAGAAQQTVMHRTVSSGSWMDPELTCAQGAGQLRQDPAPIRCGHVGRRSADDAEELARICDVRRGDSDRTERAIPERAQQPEATSPSRTRTTSADSRPGCGIRVRSVRRPVGQQVEQNGVVRLGALHRSDAASRCPTACAPAQPSRTLARAPSRRHSSAGRPSNPDTRWRA